MGFQGVFFFFLWAFCLASCKDFKICMSINYKRYLSFLQFLLPSGLCEDSPANCHTTRSHSQPPYIKDSLGIINTNVNYPHSHLKTQVILKTYLPATSVGCVHFTEFMTIPWGLINWDSLKHFTYKLLLKEVNVFKLVKDCAENTHWHTGVWAADKSR